MITEDTRIYTVGAFLKPTKINDKWVWVVAEFDGDSFHNGTEVFPVEESEALQGALKKAD